MYCTKCRRVTHTENITTFTSKNGILMRRGQCIACGKLRLNLLRKVLLVEVFLILWCTNSLSKCIYQDITLLAREQTLQKIESGWNSKAVEYTNK